MVARAEKKDEVFKASGKYKVKFIIIRVSKLFTLNVESWLNDPQ